jgi:hypothetical protein
MDQQTWDGLSSEEKEALRDYTYLCPQLQGLEGYRVEVITDYGEKRRFIVGRSTGWKPVHLEVYNRRALGGPAVERHYRSVTVLYKAR